MSKTFVWVTMNGKLGDVTVCFKADLLSRQLNPFQSMPFPERSQAGTFITKARRCLLLL